MLGANIPNTGKIQFTASSITHRFARRCGAYLSPSADKQVVGLIFIHFLWFKSIRSSWVHLRSSSIRTLPAHETILTSVVAWFRYLAGNFLLRFPSGMREGADDTFFGVVLLNVLLGVRGAGVGGVVTGDCIAPYFFGATMRLGDFNVLLTTGSELVLVVG